MKKKHPRTSQTAGQRREMARSADEKLILVRVALNKARDEATGAQDFVAAAQIQNALTCIVGVGVSAYRTAPKLDRGQR